MLFVSIELDIVQNNLDGGNENESLLKDDGTQKEVPTVKDDDDVPTDMHEKNGGVSVKEVIPIVSLQVETDDKASASVKEDQVPPADPQEISCDKSEEKTIGGSYEQEKVVEDIVKNVSGGENEDNSPVEVDELHEPSQRNASTGNNNDVEPRILAEAKFEDDNSTKVNLTDNERCSEGILVAETTQESEIRSQEAQSLTTDSQEITSHHKMEKTIDATDLKEGNLEDKNTATTTPYEEAQGKSLIQTDCSQIERIEQSVNECANPPFTEAQKAHTTESALWKEEPEMEKPMDSAHVLSENTKAPTSTQDTETSFIEQQDMTVDPHEISSGKLSNDKTNGRGEIQEVQDIATNVLDFDKEESSATKPDESEKTTFAEDLTGNITEDIEANIPSGNNEDHSPIRVDGSQEPHLAEGFMGNAAHHDSILVNEGSFIAGIVENEKITDDALIKEETTDEPSQVTEEIEASASGKDIEPIFQADQALVEKTVDNRREVITTGATDLNEDTSKEMATKAVAVEIPRAQISDVYTDTVVDFTDGHNCNQEESLGLNASDESNELVARVTSSTSEPPEQDSTKIDAQKKTVVEDGPTKAPENSSLVKSDPTVSSVTDARVQDNENKAELKQDTESRNKKDVSESNNLNDGEDRIISDNIKHMSDSSKSVALEEIPSSNVSSNSVALEEVPSSDVVSEKDSATKPSLNPIEETWLEAVNEEAQKQDEELYVSALVLDSAMEKLEQDEKPCSASVTDSVIPQEIQKLEEESLPATDKKPTEIKDMQESEITNDQTNQKDEKLGEREQEKAEEKVLSVETVVETKEPERASVSVTNDLLPKSFRVSSELDHPFAETEMATNKEDVLTGKTPTYDFEETEFEKNKEKEASKEIISDFTSAALNIRDTSDGDGADRSTSDAESPKYVQTATGANENQEIEDTSVAQTSALLPSYERHNNEHGHSGIEEKPDANELGFALEESKTEHEVKNQVLDTIDQVQSLEAAAEIVSESAIVEVKTEPIETVEVNIPSQINDDDEDVQDDHRGFCKADITERHLEDQVKQKENTETEELSEVIKNPSTTEKVSTFPEEADDKVLEDLEEIQEIQAKDEINPMYSANKGEQESTRAETWTKPTEDEHKSTCVEAEKVGISSHTEDATEVLPSDAAEDVPEEIENNATKNKYSQEKCAIEEPTGAELTGHLEAKVSGEGHAAKANEKGHVSETLKQEIDEQQVEMNSEPITKRKEVNSQENIAEYDFENISESNVRQSSVQDTAQSDETQETERSMASPLTLSAVECSNSEIAAKDLSMGFKGTGVTELKEEGTRAETWTILTEDEDKNTYVETEKVGFSSHTKDTIEVSSGDAAQVVPEDNENSTTMNKYSQEKCEKEEPTGTELTGHQEAEGSSDGQEAEANRKGPMSVTLQQERDEQQLERTSESVTRAEEVNSREEIITDYESQSISVSDVNQSSVDDTAQNEKIQTKGQVASLSISPDVKCSNTGITEKDLPMGFEGTGTTELKVTPIPSDDKHIVSKEDHTRNTNPEKSVGDNNITAVTRGNAAECSQDEHKFLKNKNIDEPLQSDLPQEYPKETSQTQPAHEKETAKHNEDLGAEKADETEHEERKPDGEKDDGEELNKPGQIELCSEAPVMVDAGDADVKVAHKKSHNILSGVGSKVKHSIAKDISGQNQLITPEKEQLYTVAIHKKGNGEGHATQTLINTSGRIIHEDKINTKT
ncbi:hypothetical protein STAS_25121 [Striga asiatica]|uniref:Uncharacterized protein n=1 Tax=Striga asiatica TaxID=4170 RepID=A0A5A7QSR8_STRAF|nr:hypothetical protein STAS_25121 [Striga asiatica]